MQDLWKALKIWRLRARLNALDDRTFYLHQELRATQLERDRLADQLFHVENDRWISSN